MTYKVLKSGESRSFPSSHPFLEAAAQGPSLVFIGDKAGEAFREAAQVAKDAPFVAIELGSECLGSHTGENGGKEGSNVVGFARFRLGDAEPSNLIEVVRQSATDPEALSLARAAFEAAGFRVAVCGDFPGRIVDRLIRPYYNAALRRLDEKLATADDLDMTLRLGLGYPEGPIALLHRTGLGHHYEVSMRLYEALGDAAYMPARRAHVAHQRAKGGDR
ncbi:3-hydroxyacyl-CoA dehydrogenase, NAD-binding [Paraburkholderia piptadeniae]|uniref:3-hydroxyacyl-CoA dehydrogenase, NAD-binding n=1 Tax=Paraburkholderia piptadeniae TaxID=1701573 RepID=A0A1N7RWC8_9BURK|nr:3-hydroxyacyl-CoA dehydrogenase family protein [Paraburkholderia piptadeniae]SIT39410.1 3-hydroxyacyl-CoA dehydrogenase, NAD-binding [Paraburkholderia piptadeniae]